MKKLLQKIKTWFVLRWKEFQSIQRDKKAMKTEREVRKVEFSKKHPVYTIATRVIAVLAALAVAIGFTCVSCRTMKDIQKQSTVTASAETIPEESSGISAYDLQDVPQFIEIDIPPVPFGGWISSDVFYAPVEFFIFPRLVIDIQSCEIFGYSSPVVSDSNYIFSYVDYTDISLCPISMWYDDGSYLAYTNVFTLDDIENEYTGSRPPYSIDTFFYLDCAWSLVSDQNLFSLVISLYGNGGIRHYSFSFNSVTVRDKLFEPTFIWYDNNLDYTYTGNLSQYSFYDYLSKSNYNIGYYDGDSVGYNRGYDVGYDLGDSVGYNRGYDEGYDGGYSVGYNRGISQTLDDVTPWQVIVDGVNKFFGLSILGNSVTIGMIMSIGFGCILFGFAIKIFLGG